MKYPFLLKCFFVGISAASAVGPIFVMTFNNSALGGFFKGFITALGSALADGILFFLGMVGLLQFFEKSPMITAVVNTASGLVLLILAFLACKKHGQPHIEAPTRKTPFYMIMLSSFFPTMFNPLTVVFFMFVGFHIISPTDVRPSLYHLALGSVSAMSGSLAVLSCVALFASKIGKKISNKNLEKLSLISAAAFGLSGIYFLTHGLRLFLAI